MIASILLDILAPILALVLLGALIRRKFHIDVGSLSKLNIYLFTPAFMFYQVSHSALGWSEMGGVVLICVLQVAALGIMVWTSGKALHINSQTLAAIALGVMFYNSGNFGLPLATLAFPRDSQGRDGAAVQTFVALSQNLLSYTVGLLIATWAGTADGLKGVRKLFQTPALYAIASALLARMWLRNGHALPAVIGKTAKYLSDGLIPIALVTLGAQMADNPRWPRWRPVSMVLLLRLIVAPMFMAVMLYGFHLIGWAPLDLWPWPAQSLILTAAVPSAIVTLLLTLEVGGDADLAADCVFWSTVACAFTLTGWLIVLRVMDP